MKPFQLDDESSELTADQLRRRTALRLAGGVFLGALGSAIVPRVAWGQDDGSGSPDDQSDGSGAPADDSDQSGATPTPTPTPAPAVSNASTQAGAGSVMGYGFQVQMWDFNQPGKQLVLDLVNNTGFNWIKHQVNWQSVEIATGVYDWSELDAIVGTAAQSGLQVLLSMNQAPTFYRSPTSGNMPSDPTKLGAFMGAVATRYSGKVGAYEVWNEENLDRETGTGNVNPATYLLLLQSSYTAIKAADPNALVVLGATSPTGVNVPGSIMDDVSYLQQLYALNNGAVANYFDVLGAHPSGFSNPPDCDPSTPQCSLSGGWNTDPSFFAFYRIGQYNQVMAQNNDGNKKIWFTEYGYDSSPTPPPGYEYAQFITEQQQAQFLVKAFGIAAQTPYVGAMFVWNLNFQLAVPSTDEKYGFGVLNQDWSPRPAFLALASMPKP